MYLVISFIIIVIIAVVLYLFLICPRFWKKPSYEGLKGVHYAHRGLFDNGSDAPENSLKAFAKAVEAGYGIEFDVQLSKDGAAMVFHDASLERMCGVRGKVWEYTCEELQTMKLADSQETIPTLAQVLETVGGKVPLIIEYKMDRVTTEVCEKGDALLKNYSGVYCIESFHPLALLWYKKHRSDVIRGQLSQHFGRRKEHTGRSAAVMFLLTHLLTNCVTRPDFIAYNHQDADVLSRKLCRKLGGLSVAYTIKSREAYEKVKDEFELFIFDSCVL